MIYVIGTTIHTTVWTSIILCCLMLLIMVGMLTAFSFFTCSRQMSRIMNVPVRPIPALGQGNLCSYRKKTSYCLYPPPESSVHSPITCSVLLWGPWRHHVLSGLSCGMLVLMWHSRALHGQARLCSGSGSPSEDIQSHLQAGIRDECKTCTYHIASIGIHFSCLL